MVIAARLILDLISLINISFCGLFNAKAIQVQKSSDTILPIAGGGCRWFMFFSRVRKGT